MLQRTSLLPVSGFPTSYPDPKNPSQKLDISALKTACWLAPDALVGLQQLQALVRLNGGELYITDMYRTWDIQAQQYAKWLAGQRKDYVAPPGESWHNAGRAVDFDIYHLNFSCIQQSLWLAKLWELAKSIKWFPIIAQPDMSQSEAWHFQHMGPDWFRLRHLIDDGQLAMAGVLDCGMWNPTDALLQNRFLQAQIMRVTQQPLTPDGQIGPKTKAALKGLKIDSLSIDRQIAWLIQAPTPPVLPPQSP